MKWLWFMSFSGFWRAENSEREPWPSVVSCEQPSVVGSRLRDLPLDALNKLEGEKPPGFTRNYEPSSDPELLVSIVW